MTRATEKTPGPSHAAQSRSAAIVSLAHELAELADGPAAFAERARRLVERLQAQRYHIAVLGEFKRGKSTLVNALIGAPVLPTGVIPVTTVATEVHFAGSRSEVLVVFEDGATQAVPPEEIDRYVSERHNSLNRLGVGRVEVHTDTVLGAPGVVLVDTPGVASINAHQTLAAEEALADSDGAVVVLSADAPLSESEERLLSALAERGGRIFVVVNKSDHLSASELSELRAFLAHHLERLLGAGACPYFVSARRALDASGGGAGHEQGDPGFAAFREDLEAFLRDDLAAERERASAAELGRLASALSQTVTIERAAATLDLAALCDRLDKFRAAAADVRRELAADRILLEHDVADISKSVASALVAGAAHAAARAWPQIEEAIGDLRGHALDRALDDAVAAAVRDTFEPLRRAAETTAGEAWERAALRFADRLRERVLTLRTAANALFEVHLPEPVLPTVAEQRERFSYHFLQVETPGASLARAVRTVLPTERSRRKMLARARQHLDSELDKHAGRARFDIVQRLDEVSRRFVTAMSAELEETESSILAAAARAQQALESTESEQAALEARRMRWMTLAHRAEQLVQSNSCRR
ncbi:MAG: dynamin family protein [Actinomycetota bacterium]|nr:dynamin family protein [Actinomycetota bacterium]